MAVKKQKKTNQIQKKKHFFQFKKRTAEQNEIMFLCDKML
jgi:hypothetical protein